MTLPQPGEWYARKTHSDGYVTHLVSLDSEPIEDEFYYGRNIAVALSGEQAALISATPDLFSACQHGLDAIRNLILGLDGPALVNTYAVMAEMTAAISKATKTE